MPQPGFFCWHVHHETLLEWCYGYDERAEYIRTEKPSHEQELRLRLFKAVKGQLPQEVTEAREAYNDARKALDEAWKAYGEAGSSWFMLWKKSYREARKSYREARKKAYNDAGKSYYEAGKAYHEALTNHKDEIEALHEDECFNCPWDGETIFSAA